MNLPSEAEESPDEIEGERAAVPTGAQLDEEMALELDRFESSMQAVFRQKKFEDLDSPFEEAPIRRTPGGGYVDQQTPSNGHKATFPDSLRPQRLQY